MTSTKEDALRRDIKIGWEQLNRGKSVEYDLKKLLAILDKELSGSFDEDP